jgi:hypothetical protein
VGAAAVALVAVGLVLTDEGDDEPTPDAGAPVTASTTDDDPAAAGPTSSLIGSEGEPLLGVEVGVSVLLTGDDFDWRRLDLDAGWVQDVEVLSDTDPQQVVPVRGGVLIRSDEGVDFASSADAAPRPLDLSHLLVRERLDDFVRVDALLGTGDPERVWLLYVAEQQYLGALIDLAGQVVVDPFPVPGRVVAGTTTGLVVSAGGDTYLATGPGAAAKIGDGEFLSASAGEVALLACDDGLACELRVVDVTTGEARSGGTVEGFADGSYFASLSPDGWLASIPHRVGAPVGGFVGDVGQAATLTLTDPGGRTSTIELSNLRSEPVWLPGDLGLLVVADGGVVRVHGSDGGLVADPIPSMRTGFVNTLMVVPG